MDQKTTTEKCFEQILTLASAYGYAVCEQSLVAFIETRLKASKALAQQVVDLQVEANQVGLWAKALGWRGEKDVTLREFLDRAFGEATATARCDGEREAREECARIAGQEAHYWASVELPESCAMVDIGGIVAASNICAAIMLGKSPEDYAKEVEARKK